MSNPLPRRDIALVFAARILRLFAYGFLSVALVLYLAAQGLADAQIGLVLTLTLLGDAGISFWLTTHADRVGRKRTLAIGALLMIGAGIVFALTNNLLILIIAAVLGVLSPSGNEIGPFLSVEQAGLTELLPNTRRTQVFAYYNLAGSFATALGALCGGLVAQALQNSGASALDSYRAVVLGYALLGVGLLAIIAFLSPAVEVSAPSLNSSRLGLGSSRNVVLGLSTLFALDAFAGGFIVQSFIAYWFHLKFGVDPAGLGALFFGANLFAGVSALAAARLAARFGLINTMVFTHIPSNILLLLVPLMPTFPLAAGLLLVRFSISQMDVPTRQSYTMAIVAPDERSAASGVTTIARSIGAAFAPVLAAPMLSVPLLFSAPFLIAGGLKIVYDLLLYRQFVHHKPPEERAARP
jgi:MFS family permease